MLEDDSIRGLNLITKVMTLEAESMKGDLVKGFCPHKWDNALIKETQGAR